MIWIVYHGWRRWESGWKDFMATQTHSRRVHALQRAIEPLEARRLLTTYYVSPTGSDSAAGSANAPFQTLQHAANLVHPGDTVDARPGTYAAGFILGWDFATAGTPTAPITFHGESGAIIAGKDSHTADGIDLEPGCDWIVIEGFTVNNASGSITRAGIRVVGSDHVTVRNNVADHNGTWGIFTGFANDVLIENNTASRSQTQHGIYVSNSGDRPVIRGNLLFGNYSCGLHMNGDLSQGGDGIISNALVENNIIHDNGAGGGSAINCDGVQDSRIQNNVLYNNHASGISLFDIDAAEGAKNNLIVNNTILMASNARSAINIKDESTGNTVYNNILYNNNPGHGAINILPDSLAGFSSDYNAVDGRFSDDDGDSVKSLAQWRSAHGFDVHSFIAAPAQLFINAASNDYHLSPPSPAIDAGTALALPKAPPTSDLEGNPRPAGAAFDIGAYEVASSSPPPVQWHQTTVADFSAGLLAGLSITNTSGGEVQLKKGTSDEFASAKLGSQWSSTAKISFTSGIASIVNGQIQSVQSSARQAVEARIRFAASPRQNFGLATSMAATAGNSWAVFTTRATAHTLYAQVNVNGTLTAVSLGALSTGYRTYRVEPTLAGFRFWIDGNVRATIAKPLTSAQLKLNLSALSTGSLRCDWVHTAYPSSGTYLSAVFDAGATVAWGAANWTTTLPAGTSITVETRSGGSATPDDTWSAWTSAANGSPLSSPASRYLQYRLTLSTTTPFSTPIFSDLLIAALPS
jgi:parallel beta-helix repeat protein